jgi:hypothetical protein
MQSTLDRYFPDFDLDFGVDLHGSTAKRIIFSFKG